jgi:peptide/nickel transport system permease protein
MAATATAGVAATPKKKKRKSQFVSVMQRVMENPAAVLGLVVFCVLVFIAFFSPVLTPYKFDKIDVLNSYQFPSLAHPCGTDQLGRDILSRLMYGARYSLQIGLWSTLFGTVFGVLFGAIAGFFGGAVDEFVMRVCDIFQSIPGQIMDVAISCALGTGFVNCIIALSISGISGTARMMRASILSIREMDYIQAASITNCSTARTIIRHLIPNAFSPIIVQATMGIGGHITAAAGLAYLGLGVQPPTPEWGAMLSEGRAYIRQYPYMCIFPGLLIVITVLSLNLLGDGLRDALDPKLKR